MSNIIFSFLLLMCCNCCHFQVTRVDRNARDILLHRPKRYILGFPEGSTFALRVSIVKAIMVKVPPGWNIILEGDLPFKLPSANYFRSQHKKHLHYRQRREIYDSLAGFLESFGFDGETCIESIRCEAQILEKIKEKTMMEDFFVTLFTYSNILVPFPENATLSTKYCSKIIKKCNFPFLNFLLHPSD